MNETAEPIRRLIDEFMKLPGIGPKSAQRLVYYLLRQPADSVRSLGDAVIALKERVIFCAICFNIAVQSPCPICADPNRDHTLICVIEEPLDIMALERTRSYRGVYHVLHGALSPQEGIGPSDLKIDALVDRVRAGGIREIVLATNPNLEGDFTSSYIAGRLAGMDTRLTRLARGLPSGGDLEYADDVTLTRAMEGRRDFR